MRILNPASFLKTIYFGDRFCTKIIIDSFNNQVEIHVNLISRIRDKSGLWNFYSDEDIENGALVITGVKEVHLDKSGLVPNDQIYDINVNSLDQNNYEFVVETSHVDMNATANDLIIKVVGEGAYLLDPAKPNSKIVD